MKDIKTYVKKPVKIKAVQFSNDSLISGDYHDIINWCSGSFHVHETEGVPTIKVKTLEGDMHARVGDYIICGTEGEFYPCKKEIFESIYDIVE